MMFFNLTSKFWSCWGGEGPVRRLGKKKNNSEKNNNDNDSKNSHDNEKKTLHLQPQDDPNPYSTSFPIPLAQILQTEYTHCNQTTYLDHAGTTPPPHSAIDAFAQDMKSHLFGNPHSSTSTSTSTSRESTTATGNDDNNNSNSGSNNSSNRIDAVRAQTLAFFNADPAHFDVVFVANATAGVKLVLDCVAGFSSSCAANNPKEQKAGEGEDRGGGGGGGGFWYGYHRDCHTSLVGPRELATFSRYFGDDDEVERWLASPQIPLEADIGLFAYPAQSNMNGRRLPLGWCGQLRKASRLAGQNIYSLLDAAAFVSTAPLDLSDEASAPDFTTLSFYKIFGFPDLGALIVRKAVSHVVQRRRYLGGGTVDMIINDRDAARVWHARKQSSLHEMLEDGTPASASIIALSSSIEVHRRLYGSMKNVSEHTSGLAKLLYQKMAALTYANGAEVCTIYKDPSTQYGDSKIQGPTIAFNVKASNGQWIGKSQIEKAAIAANIQLRTGGVCNPGGVAFALGLSAAEMRANFDEGVRCGNDVDEMHGKPTGIVRLSLGAMTSLEDVLTFWRFLKMFAETQGEVGAFLASSRRDSKLSLDADLIVKASSHFEGSQI